MMRGPELPTGDNATLAASLARPRSSSTRRASSSAPAVYELAVLPSRAEADVRCRRRAAPWTDLTRQLGEARAALSRMNEEDPRYSEVFRSLLRLEQRRQKLHRRLNL